MSDILKNDVDPIETLEWLASLESLLREEVRNALSSS